MRQEQEFRDERAKARNGGFAGDPLQSANVRRLWQNPRIEAMLLPFTLQSTQAHLRMLGDCSLIDPDIATGLASAVGDLRKRVHEGENILDRNDEDVLSAVERHLSETFGVNAGAVRLFSTPREQLSVDTRLWMRDTALSTAASIAQLRLTLLNLADQHAEIHLPTYVHLKKARSIMVADFWLTYELRFARDFQRLEDIRKKLDTLPLSENVQLSSGKVIDRQRIGQYLGFYTILENGLDAATDRDYLMEFAAFASILSVHISQLSSDLMTWSTQEFGFVRQTQPFQFYDQEVSQKRNQEVLAVLRTRPAAVFGDLQATLSAMKGLSINYSQDFEECVPAAIDISDNINFLIDLLIAYLPNLEFDVENLKDASNPVIVSGESAIQFLVDRGVDRKKAEKAVQELVEYCKQRHKSPSDMTLNEWTRFSLAFDSDIYDAIANSEMEQSTSHGNEWLTLDIARKIKERVQSARLHVEDDMTSLSAPDLHI
ncbi:MAG TPA: hypothetical protein EYN91_23090 [Candidatus Melainabacteria bacterium]|nr:hypothetical protein [Candidatus Melainabacteria bacterium]HIN63438.1 hypothetical protein [Candidatus Obscuribacterales bacterium]